ncbi:unnamed protein product, partial [marine sediment metagenome]
EEFVKEEKEKEPVKKRKESPAAQIEKVETEEEGEKIEEKPCFAKDYNELDPVCLSCEKRGDCRKAFFKASLEKRKPSKITQAAGEMKDKLRRKPRK